VCCEPRNVTARPGDKVTIINTTEYDVTVDWSNGAEAAFNTNQDTIVTARGSTTITLVKIPEGFEERFGSQLLGLPAGAICSNEPGPGVDWD
jgi:hypothetical protein